MRVSLRLSAIVAAAIAGFAGATAAAQDLKPLTVRLDWVTTGMHAPFHLATEKGLFKAAGLDPRIEDGNGSVTTVQLVGNGQFDLGHANLASMAMGRDKGLPVKSIAGFLRKSDMGVAVPVDSGIKTVKDMEGKRILYTTSSLEAPFLDSFFKAGGSSRDKINLVAVSAAAKVNTYFAARQADGVISSIPGMLTFMRTTRPSNAIHFVDYGLALPGFGFVATEEALKKKGDEIRRFVAVITTTWAYVMASDAHYEEAAVAIARQRPEAKVETKMMAQMIKDYVSYFNSKNAGPDKPIGWQAEADWAETVKAMEEAEVLRKGSKPSDYYTNDFLPAGKS